MDNINELLVAEIQEFIELDATVGKGSEGPFFFLSSAASWGSVASAMVCMSSVGWRCR